MRQLSTLYLFIHAMPYRAHTRREYMVKWEKLMGSEGPNEEHVVCILSDGTERFKPLEDLARAYFGERCIMDPSDEGPETKVLLAEDLERTFAGRGAYSEWVPYEIWTSSNARKWTEGLKKELNRLGYTYDPESLHVVTCGQQWGGCLTKYSAFMGKYLGLTKPADLRADLSPDAGFPVKAAFVERIPMDRHVYLFLFEMVDGRPMAQFMDGLRGVWEPPHVATVPIDPGNVEVVTTSPNTYLKVDEATKVMENRVMVDVGDGCHPAFTTLIATKMRFDAFRASLVKATIAPREERRRVSYMVGYLDPVTTSSRG